jgi:hypothetical protein
MERYLSEQAAALLNNGKQLAINQSLRNTLYRLADSLYVIWYTKENAVEKVQKFDQTMATEMFGDFIA